MVSESRAPTPEMGDQPILVIDPGIHTAAIISAAVDTKGSFAATGSLDKTVRAWSLIDGALLRTIRLPAGPGHTGKVYAVAISPDGTLIAAGGWTRIDAIDSQERLFLIDRASGALIRVIAQLPSVVHHVAFSLDGQRLAAVLD